MKVGTIISAALRKIRVIDPDMNPEPRQYETAIEELNRMLAEWEAANMALGWIPVSNPDEDLPLDVSAENAVVLNLGTRLRSESGAVLDVELVDSAERALAALLRLGMVRCPMIQPTVVPCPSNEVGGEIREG